jgi:hypothetical protein
MKREPDLQTMRRAIDGVDEAIADAAVSRRRPVAPGDPDQGPGRVADRDPAREGEISSGMIATGARGVDRGAGNLPLVSGIMSQLNHPIGFRA